MFRSSLVAVAAVVQFAVPAMAQEASPAMRFRQLRAEGVAAANANDLPAAAAKLAEADAVVANHPGLILLRARVAAASEQPEAALALWRRYASLGFASNGARDPLFASTIALPEWGAVADAMTANRAPVGEPEIAATIPEALAIENVIHDRARGRMLVSAIAGRTILQIDPEGAVSPWLQADAPVAACWAWRWTRREVWCGPHRRAWRRRSRRTIR